MLVQEELVRAISAKLKHVPYKFAVVIPFAVVTSEAKLVEHSE